MKKCFLLLFMLISLGAGMVSAQAADTSMPQVIPYPEGLDTKSEGASAAPQEINHQPSRYFTALDYYNMQSDANLIILSNYPTYQQSTEYTCGPAAGLTVLHYFGESRYDEMGLAREMKTQGYPIGTNPKDMAAFFRRIGWHVETSMDGKGFNSYEEFADFVQKELKAGHPIMVENVEWGGHWRVIIGYDTMGTENTLDDVLIFMDSYDTSDHLQDGYTVGNGWRFFAMWFDHFMLPEEQRSQPFILAYPAK